MRRGSIKAGMILWYSTFMFLILAVFILLFNLVSYKVSYDDLKKNLKNVVKMIADEIKDQETIVTKENLEETIDNIYIGIYAANGELLAGKQPENYEGGYEFDNKEFQMIIIDNKEYYIYDKKESIEGYDKVWVRGFLPVSSMNIQKQSWLETSMILLPLLLIVVVGGGYWITAKALKPLEKMSRTANEISVGNDLKKRIPLGDYKDEIYKFGVTMNQMLDRLESAFQDENQFTSDASHELRTPTAVILSQCEFSLENAEEKEEYEEALLVIQKQAKRMSKLIQELLMFSRMDKMEMKKEFSLVNISELIEVIIEEQQEIHDSSIVMKQKIEKDIVASANYSLLARAYQNLISNAYQYGKENGEVEVKLYQERGRVIVEVRDNGIGIEKKNIKKIWKRFFRVDEARGQDELGSMGLGLSMVQWIAEYHDGTVEVESELGKGSIFIFQFPKKK